MHKGGGHHSKSSPRVSSGAALEEAAADESCLCIIILTTSSSLGLSSCSQLCLQCRIRGTGRQTKELSVEPSMLTCHFQMAAHRLPRLNHDFMSDRLRSL